MRSLIVCLALVLAAPLAACGTFGEPASRTAADNAPNAADASMRAGRARAAADLNSAVGRSLRGD